MNLVKVGAGRWEVFLSEQVVDVLSDFSSAKGPKRAMLSFLRESLPFEGPQEGNRTICKQLNPRSLKLSEFRKGQYPGTKVRVIWFFADEATKQQVVCVRAFTKNDDETPPAEIPAAVRLRDQYFEARRKNALVIEELPRSSGGP